MKKTIPTYLKNYLVLLRHGLRRPAIPMLVAGLVVMAAPMNSSSESELEVVAQSADEIEILEDLASWIEPEDPEDISWRQAIRERHASFEVFRNFHREELRSAPLGDLPFGHAIRQTATRYDLDPLLLAAIVEVESGFNPRAVSHRGAQGLMQLMPSTARSTGDVQLDDPEDNLEAGARYLRRLLDRFDGDLVLALAAYNAGPTNVRRYDGVPPFRETRRYVEKVMTIYVEHHRKVWRSSETVERLARL